MNIHDLIVVFISNNQTQQKLNESTIISFHIKLRVIESNCDVFHQVFARQTA